MTRVQLLRFVSDIVKWNNGMLLMQSSGHLLSVSLIRDSKILVFVVSDHGFSYSSAKENLDFHFCYAKSMELKTKKLTNHSSFKVLLH
jgi:hypothetical protein